MSLTITRAYPTKDIEQQWRQERERGPTPASAEHYVEAEAGDACLERSHSFRRGFLFAAGLAELGVALPSHKSSPAGSATK